MAFDLFSNQLKAVRFAELVAERVAELSILSRKLNAPLITVSGRRFNFNVEFEVMERSRSRRRDSLLVKLILLCLFSFHVLVSGVRRACVNSVVRGVVFAGVAVSFAPKLFSLPEEQSLACPELLAVAARSHC